MTSTNDTNHTNHSVNLYTIYPGSIPTQGNVNYGFYSSHPLAPPPKYEDVVSGTNDLNMNETSLPPQSTLANVNNNQRINYWEINNFPNLQSEHHSQQVYKNKKFDLVGRPLEQHSMPPCVFPMTHQQGTSQTDVILVAPASKVTEKNRKLLLIFVISFFLGFITIILWRLAAH